MTPSTPGRLAALLLALAAPVALAQPDLSVPSVSSEVDGGDPGDRVSVNYFIFNGGNQEADDFEVGFYFSTDRTLSSDDIFVEEESGGSIDPGENEEEFEQISVPGSLAPGDYFILVVADYLDELFETDETNNTGSVAFTVNGAGGGSVDGDIDSDDQAVDAAGGTITYTVTLSNTTSQPQPLTAEVDVTLPNGSERLIRGPQTVTLQSGQSVVRTFTETVPASAPAGAYIVRLRAYNGSGGVVVSDMFLFTKGEAVDLVAEGTAARAEVEGVYPNPFSEEASIRFSLEEASDVRLAVYDALGREVAVLTDGLVQAGTHDAMFDARGLSNGLYVWHLRCGDAVQSGQISLVR